MLREDLKALLQALEALTSQKQVEFQMIEEKWKSVHGKGHTPKHKVAGLFDSDQPEELKSSEEFQALAESDYGRELR